MTSPRERLRQTVLFAGVGLLYFLTAWVTRVLVPGRELVSPIWPATGVGIAGLVLLDFGIWPGLLLGTIAASLSGLEKGTSTACWIAAGLGLAAANTLEMLAGAWLAKRFARGREAFGQPSTVLLFVALTAMLSTALGPSVGMLSTRLAGYARWANAVEVWFGWWLGDVVGTLVITPLLLVWSASPLPALRRHQWVEGVSLGLLLGASTQVAFGWPFKVQLGGAPVAFLVIPFVLWSVLRFGQHATTVVIFAVASGAIAGTLRGQGAFAAAANAQNALLLVQNYVAIVAVMSLILAADVAQRRQCDINLGASEQRYRHLFEHNPRPMWVFDYDTLRILAVNNAAIQHYGYSRDEFLSMSITDIHQAEDVPALLEAVAQARQGQEIQTQWRHLGKDGKLIEVEVTRHNLIFDGKQAAMILSTDVTQRKQAEREVLQLNQELEHRVRQRTAQLEAINKELEAFCYSVSHDLRAPLRSIRGFSEVLLERYADKLDSRGKEFLRRACESSQHMDLLIEDLLKLSRVSRSELKRQVVNLSALTQAIAAELLQAEPKRQVKFIIAAELKAQGDERLLRIVLENLLRNAWKFTGRKPQAIIEFGSVKQPEPTFFVRDNGAGFDPAYASRLFGVFQRLHFAAEFPGTGIGLATVQRIINRHGGRVWAEGEIEQGACFYFAMPAEGTF